MFTVYQTKGLHVKYVSYPLSVGVQFAVITIS